MAADVKRKIVKLLEVDFIRFCIVGGTGFVINLILLTLLQGVFKLPIVVAQLLAAEVALFSNFMLHHHWTYKSKKVEKSLSTLIVQFHASSWPAILGSSLMVGIGVKTFHLKTFEALAVSSAIALVWNFCWSKFVIWKDITDSDVERLVD